MARLGHYFLTAQGKAVPPLYPNSQPCPESCSCIPECFSWTEHHAQREADRLADIAEDVQRDLEAPAYPVAKPAGDDTDERFTLGLMLEVGEVLARAGYPEITKGADLVRLETALFRVIHEQSAGPAGTSGAYDVSDADSGVVLLIGSSADEVVAWLKGRGSK